MVVALGGNAIVRPGQRGSTEEQFANISASLDGVMRALRDGWALVLAHGNGPQVGQMLRMSEAARGEAPELSLAACVAATQGLLGHLVQHALQERLRLERWPLDVVTMITQVVVDGDDPAFGSPSKPIGPFFRASESERLRRTRGWTMVEDGEHGYRRVVASPRPLRVVETGAIRRALEAGILPIALGGGGIPVVEEADGPLRPVDAVVDKDRAAAVLGTAIGARRLALLTVEPFVFLDYGRPDQRPLKLLHADEAAHHLAGGQFAPGSMGPKVEAALDFLAGGGEEVLITSTGAFDAALAGGPGTRIVR